MRRKPLFINHIPIVLMVVLAVFTGVSYFWDQTVFIAFAVVFLIAFVYSVIRMKDIQRDTFRYLSRLSKAMSSIEKDSLSSFPIPVLVLSSNQQIVWYNDLFHERVLDGKDCFGEPLSRFIPKQAAYDMLGRVTNIEYAGKSYTIYAGRTGDAGSKSMYTLYFFDDTELKRINEEYYLSRPSVTLVTIDNMDELLQNAKESERAQLSSQIESILEKMVGTTTGFFRRLGGNRFLVVMEERHLSQQIVAKFPVLDEVRTIMAGGRMNATISLGIGRGGSTMRECEEMAKQALDMALGRGGDQAAVRTKEGYEFYGGVSKGVEKRTKVRSRIIAAALTELIESSDNVLVMGHRASDLDCLGSSVGIWRAAVTLGKPAHIVIEKERSLATPLIERLKAEGLGDCMISPDVAKQRVTKKTVLIILDTHRPDFVESPALYEMCHTVVVIDHHRKMVQHIDNAVIFFHEPYASSACEMVSELLQYMDESQIGRFEAEALLSGIMLDTKNFVLRTGVRTFEAAAYLRRKGADTVEVKKLFSGSIDSYQRKSRLVSNAEVYKTFAIACSDESGPDMRICSAQAADELLSINGVTASFVLYKDDEGVNVSARSMGAVNVQLIMEAVGGGGHHTMAGAQIKGIDLEEARDKLITSIDQCVQNRS